VEALGRLAACAWARWEEEAVLASWLLLGRWEKSSCELGSLERKGGRGEVGPSERENSFSYFDIR
jgi:hypothetical protein